jgi:protein TonB
MTGEHRDWIVQIRAAEATKFMSNTVLLPPGDPEGAKPISLRPVESVHLSGDLGEADQGVFQSLVSSVRDVFFPQKLPPLVLESQPIPVVDRMAVKRNPVSTIISASINIAILLVVLWYAARKLNIIPAPKPVQEITLVEPPPPPLKLPPKAQTMGGGGGQPDKAPVSKGNPPKFAPETLNPPKAPPLIQPKIQVPVTVDVDPNIHMAHVDMPNIGMPNSPNIGTSMGNGHGAGLGSGNGNGIGAGSGGGMGGGVRRIGGGVSPPQVLYEPEPEFSEEARKAKVAGIVTVYLQVDTTGTPRNVRVVRGIGMGLDEKALDAVRHYKFKPAMENGKPVVVEMNVEVNFQIF